MRPKVGGGALFLFCYVDVVASLAIGDWISDVGPLLLCGSPVAFVVGLFAPTVHDAYLRHVRGDAGG
ncbi:hypothetical protein BM536_006500 [Streptomyces phaeoluteigriseus]|uniref:Uncharacterized protein n=1 Tax=Streptomyces phaeoluteigriseus TaxID=114686 RepID=A0A1V6MX14_9ACTN|nr:hypothetical protein [Streptomyces phaeoluteigriseus]OQD57000.1 hypothetical protein BM536_006500 [Streptomyces phaeoluteigriseus]